MAYKAVIGLEFHCEMKSTTKVFSDARNSFSSIPNSNVSVIDMAFPGTLPIVSLECVKKAVMASSILKCKIPEYMEFDRKNYYYPDLPKGYQLTQFFNPVGTNGKVTIEVDDIKKDVFIHDIHLEEDAASLDHYYDTSTIDYNRAGVPLLELVTEPCLNSAQEAVAFLEHVRRIYKYADISEADSKKGQMRCDVNVSIMNEDDTEFGTRVEIKNVNSFAGVRDAINYEIERQSELKDEGRYDEVVQETRRFDEETRTTIHMRSKADAIDYKYFTEPNIPRYKLTSEFINDIVLSIPLLAEERKEIYVNEYNLSNYDASILIKEKEVSDYFEECIKTCKDYKSLANFIITRLLGELNKRFLTIDDAFEPSYLSDLVNMINEGKISNDQGKKIFALMFDEGISPQEIAKKYDMSVISNIDEFIDEVINENEKAIADYKNGRTNMLDYLVGQVMKKSRGKANPVDAKNKLIEKIK